MRYARETNPNKFYRPGYTRSNKRSSNNGAITYTIIGFIVVALLAFVGTTAFHSATVKEATCTVTSKDRTTNPDGNSEMRVYTEDCGTFVVQDILGRGIVNSADIYGKLENGKTYNLTYSGFRVPLMSMFPTIQEAELVN